MTYTSTQSLVITIVALLILAGASISMLMGQDGILTNSGQARDNTLIANEKEQISMAWNALIEDKLAKDKEITDKKFERELKNNGNNVTVEYDEENNYIVYFKETTHSYKVDINGKVTENKTIYYAINYVLNGGTNAEGQVIKYAGGETVSLLNATKENAYFQGWYESSDFSTSRVTKISNRNDDVTLYAKWINETPTGYFTWTTTADTATITGLSAEGLTKYNAGNLTELAIPRSYSNLSVTTIGESAFSGKNLIKELIISDSITKLNSKCFCNCTSLENLTIPISLDATAKVRSEDQPFIGCTGIKKIYFTKGNRNRCGLFMEAKY